MTNTEGAFHPVQTEEKREEDQDQGAEIEIVIETGTGEERDQGLKKGEGVDQDLERERIGRGRRIVAAVTPTQEDIVRILIKKMTRNSTRIRSRLSWSWGCRKEEKE